MAECLACVAAAENKLGVGDVVGFVANPIARVTRSGCLNRQTHQPRRGSKCARRKQKLNAIGRSVGL